jgi:copper chaperone NosL
MTSKMSLLTRIIAVIGALLLVGAIFLPVWRIELTAPQYPEGLVLKIYADKLGGDVEVVNGLNHYIGMRTLHEKDFVEFQVLPYIIGTLAFFGLLSVVVNRKWFFYVWAGFFVLFAVIAMVDFYRWEYNYGHNLDPAAPIQVPGMTYQPPLIGFKQLLNFGAYSIPDMGGWCMVATGLLLVFCVAFELKRSRHARRSPYNSITVVAIALLLMQSCSSGPQPIRFGEDACEFCKMTITDKKFGAEIETQKGKIYKFDDIHCLTSFLKSGTLDTQQVKNIYMVDFASAGNLVLSSQCFLLQSENIQAPMGSHIAAFANEDSLRSFQLQLNGKQVSWHEVNQ